MRLTAEQRRILDGHEGPAGKQAMAMLEAVGNALDAEALIPVASAHIVLDAFAMGRPGADWVVSLAEQGGRFVVPTSINAISYDRSAGPGAPVDAHQRRMLEACQAMGAVPSCSCNPFSQGIAPSFGQHVAWSESATTAYLNAVLGARSNREGATALASALTGLTPRYGMHDPAQRLAGAWFEVDARVREAPDYGLLGAVLARRAGDRIPVVTGLDDACSEHLFGFAAAFAISGNLPIFHIPGVTPEAPTLRDALPDASVRPEKIGPADLAAELARHERGEERAVDLVTIGAPHATIQDIHEVADLLAGRRVKPGVEFTLTTNCSNYEVAARGGLLRTLEASGVRVTADRMCFGCDLGAGKFAHRAVLATNSLKAALSAPGTREVETCYGTTRQCVEAAISGTWTPRRQEWN